jgi:hypothetical protein
MTDFRRMSKDASKRRKALAREIAKARQALNALEDEMTIVDQVLSALAGPRRMGRPRRGPRGGRVRGGRWRPGKPGRPPKWWVEQQKGKAAKAGKRGGRRRRRKARAAKSEAGATAG